MTCRVLLGCVLIASAACAPARVKTQPSDDWTKSLPIPPGESLKSKSLDPRRTQVITFFQLDEMRAIDGAVFISGSGYAEINGGGTFFAGMNRKIDPYLELTVTAPESPEFRACQDVLDKQHLDQHAIALSGNGYFAAMPGIGDRRLGVFRLDSVSGCKLVPRR